jgi:hypothetical protein
VRRHLDTHAIAVEDGTGPSFYRGLVGRMENGGDLADLDALRALSSVERWTPDGRWAGDYAGPVAPVVDEAGLSVLAQRMARVDGVSARADLPTRALPDDAVLIGGQDVRLRADHADVTGRVVDDAASVAEARTLAEAGAQVVSHPRDQLAQQAAQTVGKQPRRATTGVVTLNAMDPTRRLAYLQGQMDTLDAQIMDAERLGAEVPPVPPAPKSSAELELPEELVKLYQSYVFDPTRDIGVPPPRTVWQLEDALRSLDYGTPAAVEMSPGDLEALRVGLRDYLSAKYDEWGIPAVPTEMPLARLGTKLGGKAAGTTPTEHAVILDELAQELARKVYVTDEPLEGYSGVGYEFIPPPTKGMSAEEPFGTRLFYETTLTDELERIDEIVPGMGEELAGRRMQTFEKRVDTAQSHAAGVGLTHSSIPRAVRSLWDTAFGPRPQHDITGQAIDSFTRDWLELTPDELRRVVVDPALDDAMHAQRRVLLGLVRHWHEKMAEETSSLGMHKYRRVGLLDPQRMERWSREYLSSSEPGRAILERVDARKAAGIATPIWDSWRAADNRIRAYFADREGGMADFIERIYENRLCRRGSALLSGLTVNYHVFRFLMDIRWLAMEMIEAPTLLLAREGPGALWDAIQTTRGKKQATMMFAGPQGFESAMSNWAWWAVQQDNMGSGSWMRFRENAVLSQVQRAQQRGFVRELERMAREDPRTDQLRRSFGDTPEQYIHRLDRDWTLLTKRHAKLERNELEALLKPYLDEGVLMPDEMAQILRDGTWTTHPALQAAIAHADDPVTRTLLRRFEVLTSQAVNDASSLVFGQADRSNIQRLLNHPLLYWPISYQIKATKWLAGLLLDRAAGFETGAGGMTTMGLIWESHRDAMQNDPEWQRKMKDNQTLFFVASMLLPITPWDIGVTLSPWTRGALAAVTGDDPNAGYRRNIFTVGPGYTYFELLPRLFREQAQVEGSPLQGVSEAAQRFFPLMAKVPAVEAP